MRQHLTRLRLIGAFVVALLVSPALAGFVAAAACPGDAMPCCTHAGSTPIVKPGCCRIAPAQPPVQVPLRAATPDQSAASMAALPVAAVVLLILDHSDEPSSTPGPRGPGVPLYLSFSALRR